MGTVGVAPSHELLERCNAREAAWAARGGIAMLPDAQDAVPALPGIASQGLRTIPPRENGGNLDIRQLTRGSRLELPVFVTGGLFSAGDAHYAQGDSECCITAIEMGATMIARIHLHKGEAARRKTRFPRFSHPGWFMPPRWAAPHDFIATTGFPITPEGEQHGEDLTLADIQFGHVLFRYFDIAIARTSRPALRRYYEALTTRPAYREHVMVSYEELRVLD
jgi:formamidase